MILNAYTLVYALRSNCNCQKIMQLFKPELKLFKIVFLTCLGGPAGCDLTLAPPIHKFCNLIHSWVCLRRVICSFSRWRSSIRRGFFSLMLLSIGGVSERSFTRSCITGSKGIQLQVEKRHFACGREINLYATAVCLFIHALAIKLLLKAWLVKE